MTEITIIPLKRNHCDNAARLLADAFLEDPEVAAIVGGNLQKRRQILKAHYHNLVSLFLPYRRSQCAVSNGELVGVMLFFAPGEEPSNFIVFLKLSLKMLFRISIGGLRRGYKSANNDETHRPREPHYYLSTLGVAPSHQGRGVGKRMLSYITDIADENGSPIYLSSTNPKAIPLYQKFGFETTLVTSPLGVPNHHMERKPRKVKEASRNSVRFTRKE
jgi:ribosomal protein S18 acetylase RimI-like enzyme